MPNRPDLDLSGFYDLYKPYIEGLRGPLANHNVDLSQLSRMPVNERPVTVHLSRVGVGPIQASSCTDLTIRRLVCWDVSGYYRALGVHWQASRRELREAYLGLDGQSSPELTYILHLLLDPTQREAYDLTPLGHRFFDHRLNEAIKMQAKREAARRTLDQGYEVDAREVLSEMGYSVEDGVSTFDKDDDEPHIGWEYSYFLWKVRCYDVDRLELWQSLLVQAYAEVGLRGTFAVGFGETSASRFTRTEMDGIVTHYLGPTVDPTQQIARDAVQTLTPMDRVLKGPPT